MRINELWKKKRILFLFTTIIFLVCIIALTNFEMAGLLSFSTTSNNSINNSESLQSVEKQTGSIENNYEKIKAINSRSILEFGQNEPVELPESELSFFLNMFPNFSSLYFDILDKKFVLTIDVGSRKSLPSGISPRLLYLDSVEGTSLPMLSEAPDKTKCHSQSRCDFEFYSNNGGSYVGFIPNMREGLADEDLLNEAVYFNPREVIGIQKIDHAKKNQFTLFSGSGAEKLQFEIPENSLTGDNGGDYLVFYYDNAPEIVYNIATTNPEIEITNPAGITLPYINSPDELSVGQSPGQKSLSINSRDYSSDTYKKEVTFKIQNINGIRITKASGDK